MEYYESMRARPVYNLQTFLRGISKNDERVYPVVPDGIYGEDTKRSVESFQNAYNLPATGEVDSETWGAIVREYEIYERYLEPVSGLRIIRNDEIILKGDNHSGIYIIQAMINSLSDKFSNFKPVDINGVYDEKTSVEIENLKLLFDVSEENITKEFINRLVDLYEHVLVFKKGYYDKSVANESLGNNISSSTEQIKQTNPKVNEENNVIVWKFF